MRGEISHDGIVALSAMPCGTAKLMQVRPVMLTLSRALSVYSCHGSMSSLIQILFFFVLGYDQKFKTKEKYSQLLTFYLNPLATCPRLLNNKLLPRKFCPAVELIINIVLLCLLFLLLFSGYFCYIIRYLPKQIMANNFIQSAAQPEGSRNLYFPSLNVLENGRNYF